MAGKTYAKKGYSTYTDIPAQRGGYDHAVETKTIERVCAPAARYTDFVRSPSKAELLKEYVYSPSVPVSPKNKDYELKYGFDVYQKSSPTVSPNKHIFSSPARGYFSEETNRANSGPGLLAGSTNVKNGNISLKTSTNNVDEDSVYYSPRADPRRRGVLDELSTRAQPLEPQRRYARPAFVAKSNEARLNFTNTGSAIDSHEAMRRYRGSLVP